MADELRSIDELALENQRVFIRVDFDVPIRGGEVGRDSAIRKALPTIKKAQSAGARVVLGTRLGRPEGRPRAEFGLEPVGVRLSELLESEIYLPDESIGEAARKVVQDLRPGQVCLLENLAFHAEEDQADEAFARKLAALADVYVNDAPRSIVERSASAVLLPRLLRDRAAGYELIAELAAFRKLKIASERPFVAVIGGTNAAQKLDLIQSLIGRAQTICVGGVVGNTLLRASGIDVGASLIDSDALARGRGLLARARERGTKLLLPLDLAVGTSPERSAFDIWTTKGSLPKESLALDIGPQTSEAFSTAVSAAKTVLVYGALGVVENDSFQAGTRGLVRAVSESGAFSVFGGTSAVSALAQEEWAAKLSFVSTSGSASLELLSDRKLPAIEALRGGAT